MKTTKALCLSNPETGKRKIIRVVFQTVQEFQSKANVLDKLNERRIQQQSLIEQIDSETKTYLEIIMKYYKTFQDLTSGHIHTAIDLHNRSKIREKSVNMGHQNRKAPESTEINENKDTLTRDHENAKGQAKLTSTHLQLTIWRGSG